MIRSTFAKGLEAAATGGLVGLVVIGLLWHQRQAAGFGVNAGSVVGLAFVVTFVTLRLSRQFPLPHEEPTFGWAFIAEGLIVAAGWLWRQGLSDLSPGFLGGLAGCALLLAAGCAWGGLGRWLARR
jgi:hypothetical protein